MTLKYLIGTIIQSVLHSVLLLNISSVYIHQLERNYLMLTSPLLAAFPPVPGCGCSVWRRVNPGWFSEILPDESLGSSGLYSDGGHETVTTVIN